MYLAPNVFFWSPPMALINDNRPFCANTYCNGQKWNPSTALLSKIGWHYRLLTPQCKDPPSNPSLKRVPLKCFSFNKLHRFPYDAKFRLSFFNAMGGPTSTHWVHYKRLCKVYASCFKNMQVEFWPVVFSWRFKKEPSQKDTKVKQEALGQMVCLGNMVKIRRLAPMLETRVFHLRDRFGSAVEPHLLHFGDRFGRPVSPHHFLSRFECAVWFIRANTHHQNFGKNITWIEFGGRTGRSLRIESGWLTCASWNPFCAYGVPWGTFFGGP